MFQIIGRKYQQLTRYTANACATAQDMEGPDFSERWMAARMVDFLNGKMYLRKYAVEAVAPDEFKTGKAGGQSRVDIVGRLVHKSTSESISSLIEVKLMLDKPRPWGEEVLTDVFRVASVRKGTSKTTDRLIMNVGQQQAWDLALKQCGGLLGRVCPMECEPDFLKLRLANKTRKTTMSMMWKEKNAKYIENYLIPHLPTDLSLQLVGLHSTPFHDEEDKSITARLWRVRIGKLSTAVAKP